MKKGKLTYEASLDAVRLDHDESLLHFCDAYLSLVAGKRVIYTPHQICNPNSIEEYCSRARIFGPSLALLGLH